MIPPLEVDDTQAMLDGQLDMVPVSYFLEQVSAKLPFGIPPKIGMLEIVLKYNKPDFSPCCFRTKGNLR